MQEGSCRFRFCIPLALTLSRLILALCLFCSVPIPLSACLFWAILSDVGDGFLARLFKVESTLGTYLDPIADKLFALSFVFSVYETYSFSFWQLALLFSRDIALILFLLILLLSKKVPEWRVRAFFFGKVATSLQFFTFYFLSQIQPIPEWIWVLFGVVGIGSFVELIVLLYSRLRQAFKPGF